MRLIDADAFRQRMYHEAFETDTDMQKWDSGCWIRYKLFENCIDEMPTISPDDVRGVGKWIWHDNLGWDDSLECSYCAEEFVVYDGEFPGIDSFKFCPNCGAKMTRAEAEKAMEVMG